ncbi:MurR/RpiR family transcriptional regulator [Lacticaseibacillus absianus]|uniref:MurR/RpiR family transcriptional regulator n=1 Tax=Lacticaseibacillus absianus TaxID=2729623 RepID=UPI0015CA83AC|nr:MurR/RpiR family transcriptional regulator [Lacticaseibacillus absianus]
MSVRGNIQNASHELSTTENQIADYVLAHPNEVLNMSVQDLAKASGTSASTVSRFARRLNFGGYNELKLQLSADLTAVDNDSALYEEIQRDESLYAIKSKLLNNAERSLRETVDQIRPERVEEVITRLQKCRQILLFGVGASYLVIENIAQKWSRLGYACVASDDPNQILPLIVTTNPKDSVLWLVSNSGESPEVVLAAQLAKEAGVPIITTTKMGTNTLSRLGDVSVQTSQPMESSTRIAATQSLHAQFMLIDIVYYAFVSKHYTNASKNVNISRKAIETYKQSMHNGF